MVARLDLQQGPYVIEVTSTTGDDDFLINERDRGLESFEVRRLFERITSHLGEQERCCSGGGEFDECLFEVSAGAVLPTLGDELLIGRDVEADRDPPGVGSADLPEEDLVCDGDRPHDDPPRSGVEEPIDLEIGADTATDLYGNVDFGDDLANQWPVHVVVVDGRIEVDDVETVGTLSYPSERPCDGIGIEVDHLIECTTGEANSFAIEDVDACIEFHGPTVPTWNVVWIVTDDSPPGSCSVALMRYGAFIPQGWRLDLVGIDRSEQWPTMLGVAKTIESLGYESAWVFDHFHTVPVPTQESSYEAWTLMAALAATTDSVRLGQMCTSNSYRNPAYLAKIAADIDVISNGRVEMGIGAGWYENEYLGYGYEFPKPSVRIGQLEEGVEIMRRMWAEDEVRYDGQYYQLAGAISRPKPIQDSIPIWVAGGGEKLTLRVAARFADYTNFGWTVDEFVHKSEVLAGHTTDIGRDYDEIVRSSLFTILVAETENGVQAKIDEYVGRIAALAGQDKAESARESLLEGGLVGTPEQVVEQLRPWVEVGMSYAIGYFPDAAYDSTSLELFAQDVVPHFD